MVVGLAAVVLQAGCVGCVGVDWHWGTAGPIEAAQPGPARTDSGNARRVIRPAHFPADAPYSHGVRVGDTLFLSGQIGRHPRTNVQPDGIAGQTRQAMENVGDVLKADGLGYEHLVKCHVYLASMDDYAGMNQVYGGFFTDTVPARTTVEAVGLPGDARVEIACIAHADAARISVVRPAQGSLPAPLGPYSAAVWAGDTLYLSGMGGQHPADRRVSDVLAEQVTQTLANIETTLTAAGVGTRDVVSAHAYITHPDEMSGFAAALAQPFGEGSVPPASVIALPRLPGAIKAELTFVATRPSEARHAVAAGADARSGLRAIRAGNRLYVRAESAPAAGAGVAAQFRAVLARLRQTVQDGGMQWRDVAHVQVYLGELAGMPDMDAVFRETFPDQPPARTTLQVRPTGQARIQVALVAAR